MFFVINTLITSLFIYTYSMTRKTRDTGSTEYVVVMEAEHADWSDVYICDESWNTILWYNDIGVPIQPTQRNTR